MASSRISCVYCEKTFAFSSGLSRHLKNEHPEEREKNHSLDSLENESEREDIEVDISDEDKEYNEITEGMETI